MRHRLASPVPAFDTVPCYVIAAARLAFREREVALHGDRPMDPTSAMPLTLLIDGHLSSDADG